ncbi:Ig-like domain-containing protein [Romboutsia lituseburensis]|uniref:Ig-like domain-containing protein n=1 Tax=Romboutsia lituseburensis TaxID=1537 RepID=UPI00215A98B3|nr:Ig-like domain-containing protein [Romboutsia lituseburensis]MCR8744762.1 Ig-like domain-containing protein [Romboutsia lituseburensis]
MITLDVSKQNIVIDKIGDYEIIGKTSDYNIYIDCKANITLSSVDIDVSKKSIGAMIIGKMADVNLTFIGTNNLKSADNYAGIQMEEKSKLLIQGDENSYLNIYSGTSAAGIGGGYGQDLEGTVTIERGAINVVSTREGAGIGGGNGTNGGGNLSGNLIINGGILNIKPGDSGGAGIGGGCNGSLSGNVYIYDGKVNCIAGKYTIGAGIGGGYDADLSGSLLISGGYIVAIGGEGAAGIGSSINIKNGAKLSGNVTIKGGIVNATGGQYLKNYGGAGIGSGYGGDFSGNIILDTGEITARGYGSANDIGSGSKGEITGDVVIKINDITVSPAYLILNIGEYKKIDTIVNINPIIHANIGYYTKIEYMSQNGNIATVNENGLVKGIGEGETLIIVTSLLDKSKFAVCKVKVSGKNINIGEIDLLIEVEKDTINPNNLKNIVCYGNNPIIKKIYINSAIKEANTNIIQTICENNINAKYKYNYTYIYLYVYYSIALYTVDECISNLKIYALNNACMSSNIEFCLNENEEFNIEDYKIIINTTYEIDEKYSKKCYLFNIKGNIELIKQF